MVAFSRARLIELFSFRRSKLRFEFLTRRFYNCIEGNNNVHRVYRIDKFNVFRSLLKTG